MVLVLFWGFVTFNPKLDHGFPPFRSPPASKAAFDQRQCQVSLFGGDGGSGSYMCSQSLFVLDVLFNPDPSVTPSELNLIVKVQNFGWARFI